MWPLPSQRLPALRSTLWVICALWATLALGDGLSVGVEPEYSSVTTKNTDQAGVTTATNTSWLQQRYRLTLDQRLYPFVLVGGGAQYERRVDTFFASPTTSQFDTQRTLLN